MYDDVTESRDRCHDDERQVRVAGQRLPGDDRYKAKVRRVEKGECMMAEGAVEDDDKRSRAATVSDDKQQQEDDAAETGDSSGVMTERDLELSAQLSSVKSALNAANDNSAR